MSIDNRHQIKDISPPSPQKLHENTKIRNHEIHEKSYFPTVESAKYSKKKFSVFGVFSGYFFTFPVFRALRGKRKEVIFFSVLRV
jgi:hypothetical protein